MLIKNKCSVHLIGATHASWFGLQRYLDSMGVNFISDGPSDVEQIIEMAGRICYLSFEKTRPAIEGMTRNETYIRHLMSVGHESVFEHVTFNFIFSGIDRAVSHELVRHRVGTAFSQLSSRYVDQFGHGGLGLMVRPELNEGETALVSSYYSICKSLYERISVLLKARGIEGKKAREIAATLLPNGAETQMMFSVNLRELRHIFRLRCGPMANASIRRLFMEVYRQFVLVWPVLVCDFISNGESLQQVTQ